MAAKGLLQIRKNIKMHAIDDSQLLLLSTHPDEIYFSGCLNVKSLLGSIEIMGYEMTPSQPSIMAFSAKENCILKISMLPDSGSIIDKSYLETLNLSASLVKEILSNLSISHLILLSKNTDNSFLPVLRNYDMPMFFKENIDRPISLCLEPRITNYSRYQDLDEWRTIFHKITTRSHPRTVLCGGLGVGKSTLLKFLVNKSLGKWSEVIVIDLDPGQSEFTVMGCLSVVCVQHPVIGPNFSHLMVPKKSLFFGDNHVSGSDEKYAKCVKTLVDYCLTNFSQVPWFVNTMGFTESLGIKLLFGALINILPTDVIQLISWKEKDNFPEELFPDFWRKEKYTSSKLLNYELHCLPSVGESNYALFDVTACGLNRPTRRNIVTLSYFSELICSHGDLLSLIPRKISLNSVKISIEKSSSDCIPTVLSKFQTLCCINANMVALCHEEVDSDLLDWIGYGIVRGFNADVEELAIITPLSDAQLLQVNTVCMSSSIQLPEVVYRKQAHPSSRHTPYVMKLSKQLLHTKIKKSSSRIKYRND